MRPGRRRSGGRTGVEAATPARGDRHVPAGSRQLQAGSLMQLTPVRRRLGIGMAAAVVASFLTAGLGAAPASAAPLPAAPHSAASATDPAFGPNVLVFDPSMPQAEIQATVDAVHARQVSDQFGTGRFALLFKPGTYGSAAQPLRFSVGYYTEVAGLGRNPTDTVINGSIDV